jgi:type IV secretory pathway TrbF-like protein
MATSRLPYVVALDDVGRAVPVIPAKQVAVKDVRLQEAVVARWVTNLRTVRAIACLRNRARSWRASPERATALDRYERFIVLCRAAAA